MLFEAERAWAHSQDLGAQSLLPANAGRVGTLRHSATGRFRRAVHWSTQLLSHCQSLYKLSHLEASSLIQATVYTLILNGRFLRYRDDFEDALIQLSVARGLLDELAERAETSRDQALATLFADEIGPEIRYCAHQLGRETAYNVDAIVKEVSGKHRGEIVDGYDGLIQAFKKKRGGPGSVHDKKMLETLMWEGQPVPVRNPELVDVLLKVQEGEGKIAVARDAGGTGRVGDKGKKKEKGVGTKKGFAAYDAVLLALSDAENVARKLLEAQQVCWDTFLLSCAEHITEHEYFVCCCRGYARHSICALLHCVSTAVATDSARSGSCEHPTRLTHAFHIGSIEDEERTDRRTTPPCCRQVT